MGLFDWFRRTSAPKSAKKAGGTAAAAGGPTRPLLYAFQHVALREAAFENHPELIRELAEGPSTLPLLHFRSKALIRCMEAGLIDADPGEDDAAALEAENELFSPVAVHPRRQAGYTAHIVAMPAPETCPEAYFVAIVHKDDEAHEYMRDSPATRYFTLEKADGPGRPLVCEWRRDGSRGNYGEGPAANIDAFVQAVFDRVAADVGGRA